MYRSFDVQLQLLVGLVSHKSEIRGKTVKTMKLDCTEIEFQTVSQ